MKYNKINDIPKVIKSGSITLEYYFSQSIVVVLIQKSLIDLCYEHWKRSKNKIIIYNFIWLFERNISIFNIYNHK